jgi:hypothetical protein
LEVVLASYSTLYVLENDEVGIMMRCMRHHRHYKMSRDIGQNGRRYRDMLALLALNVYSLCVTAQHVEAGVVKTQK